MTLTDRHMIRLDRKPQLFSFRVAGILFCNGHVLAQRGIADDFWALPGGRAEIGEDTGQTLVREMREELGRDVTITRLLWTVENFFRFDGYEAHELGFYYLMELEGDFPFHECDVVHRIVDATEVEFRWIPATRADFALNRVMPTFIGEHIEALPQRHEHLIVREW